MAEEATLTLLLGGVRVSPAPRELVDALDEAQVTVTAGQRTGFQLTFSASSASPITREWLPRGRLDPPTRVVLVATLRGASHVLVDGVITRHDVAPGPQGGRLTLTGMDLTQLMDQIDLTGLPLPAMPLEAQVALILAKWAVYGVVPQVVPSVLVHVPNPLDEIPAQQGTDDAHIRRAADAVGYVFHLTPGPQPGTSVAYWGPELRVGAPQPALSVDFDAATNVASLSFSFNGMDKTVFVLMVQEENAKVPVPVPLPDVTPLSPPLGARIPPPMKWAALNRNPARRDDTAPPSSQGLLRTAARGLARAAQSAQVITATGTLDVGRYGRLLEARRPVGVRGAGPAYDGLYIVTSTTTTIRRGQITQSFSLARNAHTSLTSEVAT